MLCYAVCTTTTTTTTNVPLAHPWSRGTRHTLTVPTRSTEAESPSLLEAADKISEPCMGRRRLQATCKLRGWCTGAAETDSAMAWNLLTGTWRGSLARNWMRLNCELK
ncbi:hypothetical protein E2C01_007329 [Portunus trituberculatus]|uniref:Uncharacterized protein n=1 Tax=Portunus trituberculatus TaxID=210409 RepID=A0A5B7D077_PORTR|nr:hypothetical protein [Portunus trituberculatus]